MNQDKVREEFDKWVIDTYPTEYQRSVGLLVRENPVWVAWQSAYKQGRQSMRYECVNVLNDFDFCEEREKRLVIKMVKELP